MDAELIKAWALLIGAVGVSLAPIVVPIIAARIVARALKEKEIALERATLLAAERLAAELKSLAGKAKDAGGSP